jgi:hypothetical protein
MGLRAVRDDGSPMRFRQALVRALMRAIVEGPQFFGVPAIVCSMISDRGKRIGDLMAGTVVLQERIPTKGTDVFVMPPPLAGWATTLDLSRFDDGMALSARQFLGRAADLSPTARESLGAQLVASVQQVVTPPAPAGTPGWAYLAAVLAERRRRDEQRHGIGPGWGAPGYGYGQQAYGQQGHPSAQPQYAQSVGYPTPAPPSLPKSFAGPPNGQPSGRPQQDQPYPGQPRADQPSPDQPRDNQPRENPFTLPG